MNDQFPLIGDEWSEDDPYCGALLVPVDRQGRILLQMRDHGPNTVHPGRWGLFGGGVEPGETLLEAVIREFEEEVGIAIDRDAPRPLGRILSTPEQRRLFVFYARLALSPRDVSLGEGAGFGFFRVEDLPGLDLIEFVREVLSQYAALDAGGLASGRAAPD